MPTRPCVGLGCWGGCSKAGAGASSLASGPCQPQLSINFLYCPRLVNHLVSEWVDHHRLHRGGVMACGWKPLHLALVYFSPLLAAVRICDVARVLIYRTSWHTSHSQGIQVQGLQTCARSHQRARTLHGVRVTCSNNICWINTCHGAMQHSSMRQTMAHAQEAAGVFSPHSSAAHSSTAVTAPLQVARATWRLWRRHTLSNVYNSALQGLWRT